MKRPEMIDDLKGAPDVMRDTVRDTDQAFAEKIDSSRTAANALDWRTVLTAAAIALVIAGVLRIIVLGPMVSVVLFVVLFLAGWALLANSRFPPFARSEEKDDIRRRERERSEEEGDGEEEDGEEEKRSE